MLFRLPRAPVFVLLLPMCFAFLEQLFHFLFLISDGNVFRYEGAEGSTGPDTVLGIGMGRVVAIGGRSGSAKSAVEVEVFVRGEREWPAASV